MKFNIKRKFLKRKLFIPTAHAKLILNLKRLFKFTTSNILVKYKNCV